MTSEKSLAATRSRHWIIAGLGVALVAVWIVPGLTGVLHETDQAALLDGAWQLAHGTASPFALDAYNYDKMFVAYWALAGALRLTRAINSGVDPVLVSNVLAGGFLTCAAFWVLWALRRRRFSVAKVAAVLFAPTFVCHAAFFGGAPISAGFLWLLFLALEHRQIHWRIPRLGLLALLSFAAVGARADAVLVFPLLVWVSCVPLPKPLRALTRLETWALLAGALAAILLGKRISPTISASFLPPAFDLRIFAGYSAFGLGSALVVALFIFAVCGSGVRAPGGQRKAAWLLGLLSVLLPFLFYTFQLFSTRYWFPGCLGLLFFALSKRGVALELVTRKTGISRTLSPVLGVVTILPLLVGVRMPFVGKIHLTFTHPTVFPTGDGLNPMGAWLTWSWLPIFTDRKVPDHSHALWLAARATHFETDENGAVEILNTPMTEIVRFAARAQGKEVRLLGPNEAKGRLVYADLRSLIKDAGVLSGGLKSWGDELIDSVEADPVSPIVAGNQIVRLIPTKFESSGSRIEPSWKVFRRAFAGSDFHLCESTQLVNSGGRLALPVGAGRSSILIAREPFTLLVENTTGADRELFSIPESPDFGWHVLALDGRDLAVGNFRLKSGVIPSGFEVAEAVLPDYMSARSFGH